MGIVSGNFRAKRRTNASCAPVGRAGRSGDGVALSEDDIYGACLSDNQGFIRPLDVELAGRDPGSELPFQVCFQQGAALAASSQGLTKPRQAPLAASVKSEQ